LLGLLSGGNVIKVWDAFMLCPMLNFNPFKSDSDLKKKLKKTWKLVPFGPIISQKNKD
jgi:hypothetical protein